MRRLIVFPCAGETLFGTLDEAEGDTGLLIVSGGSEVRMGAHRGMAELAARLAGAGTPVFRFDRRGVGDSSGQDQGFEASAEDIAAASATFAAEMPHLRRIVAFGNCDAATALALYHRGAGIDGLILANPWVTEDSDALPPAAAIRARYAERLRDPRQWLRLATGGVDLLKLGKGLSKLSKSGSQPRALAERMAEALAGADVPVTLLLAARDNTAIAFYQHWHSPLFEAARAKVRYDAIDTASHSFAGEADKQWLFERIRMGLIP
ncbi:hydrolase 1, exosortase A system-associated [Sphingomonas sp.]|uniref:hydrolase 1, exosortase A system-associated n=1 Tax=Sphingomonas sp. TaxID=28214 RepID=UPI001AFDC21E|nr:hydrolase 1, exosortase A system-associated [Sphingomonas sp.]MBO9712523.1 hydrolase 1, exosortase A system-associated [Sphingomonas sp.]